MTTGSKIDAVIKRNTTNRRTNELDNLFRHLEDGVIKTEPRMGEIIGAYPWF